MKLRNTFGPAEEVLQDIEAIIAFQSEETQAAISLAVVIGLFNNGVTDGFVLTHYGDNGSGLGSRRTPVTTRFAFTKAKNHESFFVYRYTQVDDHGKPLIDSDGGTVWKIQDFNTSFEAAGYIVLEILSLLRS
jgi:hypothetical protein